MLSVSDFSNGAFCSLGGQINEAYKMHLKNAYDPRDIAIFGLLDVVRLPENISPTFHEQTLSDLRGGRSGYPQTFPPNSYESNHSSEYWSS